MLSRRTRIRAHTVPHRHTQRRTRTLACTWLMPSHSSARHTHKPVKPSPTSRHHFARLVPSCTLTANHHNSTTRSSHFQAWTNTRVSGKATTAWCSLLPSAEGQGHRSRPKPPRSTWTGHLKTTVEARAGWPVCAKTPSALQLCSPDESIKQLCEGRVTTPYAWQVTLHRAAGTMRPSSGVSAHTSGMHAPVKGCCCFRSQPASSQNQLVPTACTWGQQPSGTQRICSHRQQRTLWVRVQQRDRQRHDNSTTAGTGSVKVWSGAWEQ